MTDTAALLLLPHLRVQNANAIQGPLSWGFPSPTAFLGFTHALERRIHDRFGITFGGVGIVCHRFEPQVFFPPGRRHQVLRLTRNPVFAGWKTRTVARLGINCCSSAVPSVPTTPLGRKLVRISGG